MDEYLSNVLRWFCYILMLWEGTIETLDQFMKMLSNNSYNLKFTMQSSMTTIAYLHVTINIGIDGTISTSLFRKPTSGNTILHASSAHPRSLVQSIPFGQYLRLRRNCSSDVCFRQEAGLFYEGLLARGYRGPA